MLNINNIINDGFIPYKYSFRAINDKSALCVVKRNREKFICLKAKEKHTEFNEIIKEYKEENSNITIFRLSLANYRNLKNIINLSPKKINKKISFGTGDRTGKATVAHLKAISKSDAFPIIAQQTTKELQILKRSYNSCLLDAVMGVLESGYQGDWGADANNITSMAELEEAINASYSMYTIDISKFIPKTHENDDLSIYKSKLNQTSLDIIKEITGLYFNKFQFFFKEEELIYSAYSLQHAMDVAIEFYNKIKKHTEEFDFEIGINKSERKTTPEDYIFIELYLQKHNINFTSIAPNLVGEFTPGCEWKGNHQDLTNQINIFSEISNRFGEHKISIHGSDKFSIYKDIQNITDNFYHIKTSGTSWLRVPLLAALYNKQLFEKMFNIAIEHEKENIPTYNENHPELFVKDEKLTVLFHVNYGNILGEMKNEINEFLSDYEKEYYYLIEKHIEKHFPE